MAKVITIKCKGSGTAPIEALKIIQGELKTLSEENKSKLRRRIETCGFDAPLFIWRHHVLDGTQRLRVLQEMLDDGWTLPKGEVPICEIAAKNLTEAKERLLGYVSQYGKIEAEGFMQFTDGLDLDLGTLDLPDFDLDGLMDSLEPETQNGTDPDDIPEPPTNPISKPGDLWLLGEHRLLCGDATKAEDVERLMNRKKAAMIFTDPPYGVDYQGGQNAVKRDRIAGDASPALYGPALALCAQHAAHDVAMYVWFAGSKGGEAYSAVAAAGFTVRAMVVWNKLNPHYGAFMAQYMQRHEPCLYCVRGTAPWNGPTNEVTVWDVDQPSRNEYHPTQKPVVLAERAITNSSNKGGTIVDPFLGSGTTLIAAEKLGRRCYGLEIEPKYCDVIVERWENFTGGKAKRAKR